MVVRVSQMSIHYPPITKQDSIEDGETMRPSTLAFLFARKQEFLYNNKAALVWKSNSKKRHAAANVILRRVPIDKYKE